jgi:segregation and condensation protein B
MSQKGQTRSSSPNRGEGDNGTPPAEEGPNIRRIIEALLFVGGPPLTAGQFVETLRGHTAGQFEQAIHELNQDYQRQGRPYAIVADGPGYALSLEPGFQSVAVRIHGTAREARLSAASIDVLALVAYRQPVTKAQIDALRGADSGASLRQLVRRGLITVEVRADAGRKEARYTTSARFLDLFGLKSLEDLPQTLDLRNL